MIGLSSPLFSTRPFEEAFEKINPNFPLWEIVSEANHFLPDIQNKIKEAMETTNMVFQVHAPYSDINLAAFDSRTRDYSINMLEELVGISDGLGIKIVTIHPGKVGPIQSYARERVAELTRQSLEELDKRCSQYSTKLALENMPVMKYTICHKAREMETMLENLQMGFCLDVGHSHLAGDTPNMMRLKSRLANVHLSDNLGDRDSHMALGKGKIDFREIMGLLDGYTGNFIIETRSFEDGITGRDYLSSSSLNPQSS